MARDNGAQNIQASTSSTRWLLFPDSYPIWQAMWWLMLWPWENLSELGPANSWKGTLVGKEWSWQVEWSWRGNQKKQKKARKAKVAKEAGHVGICLGGEIICLSIGVAHSHIIGTIPTATLCAFGTVHVMIIIIFE